MLLPGCAAIPSRGRPLPAHSSFDSPAETPALTLQPKDRQESRAVKQSAPTRLVGYSLESTPTDRSPEAPADRVGESSRGASVLIADTGFEFLDECPLSLAGEQHLDPEGVAACDCTAVDDDLALIDRICEDHRNFYSLHNLGVLSVGFGTGAIFANTRWDEDISRHFNSSVKGASTDEWAESFHSPKAFGDGLYTLPVFAAAWGVGTLFDDTTAGDFSREWGERSLRSFLVGVPPLLLMQKATGASRPGEGESHWHFWEDNNGVSGHSFMGSLPFLTAAQMVDAPFYKCLLYLGSTAVPISRVSDGDHYPSQALLGWWMAWSATMAIDATQDRDSHWRTVPLIGPGCSGFNLEYRW